MSRIIKFILVFILIIFVGFLLYLKYSNKRSGYVFDKVRRSALAEIVSESGIIISDGNTAIYSPTDGMIEDIYVSNNDPVKVGQKLFKVTSSATEIEKQTAKASYLTAKSTLDLDNAQLLSLQAAMFAAWDIQHNLAIDEKYQNDDKSPNYGNRALPEYAIADANWLSSEAAYKSQQGVITKDKVALNSAYLKYLSTLTSTITSPIAGVVDNLAYSKGKSVQAKDLLSSSTKPVLIIKNSDKLEAVITVGQTNIAKIAAGQKIVIKPDAYKDKKYSGTITRLDSIGTNVAGVITYNVYASIEKDELLRSGMTFDGDITTKSVESVLTVPNSAIITDKGIKNVRVLENNKLKNIPVTTGIKGATHTEIVSGLSENQEIISGLTNEKATRPGFLGL